MSNALQKFKEFANQDTNMQPLDVINSTIKQLELLKITIQINELHQAMIIMDRIDHECHSKLKPLYSGNHLFEEYLKAFNDVRIFLTNDHA